MSREYDIVLMPNKPDNKMLLEALSKTAFVFKMSEQWHYIFAYADSNIYEGKIEKQKINDQIEKLAQGLEHDGCQYKLTDALKRRLQGICERDVSFKHLTIMKTENIFTEKNAVKIINEFSFKDVSPTQLKNILNNVVTISARDVQKSQNDYKSRTKSTSKERGKITKLCIDIKSNIGKLKKSIDDLVVYNISLDRPWITSTDLDNFIRPLENLLNKIDNLDVFQKITAQKSKGGRQKERSGLKQLIELLSIYYKLFTGKEPKLYGCKTDFFNFVSCCKDTIHKEIPDRYILYSCISDEALGKMIERVLKEGGERSVQYKQGEKVPVKL